MRDDATPGAEANGRDREAGRESGRIFRFLDHPPVSGPDVGATGAYSNTISAALGAPQLAGTFVSPKGLTKRMTGDAAMRQVGRAITGSAVAPGTQGPFQGAPAFGNVGYIAVTADEVAIVQAKTGAMKPKVGSEVIARVSRSAVTSVKLDPHMLTASLKIAFADGGSWEFEVPKKYRETAQQVVHALEAPTG